MTNNSNFAEGILNNALTDIHQEQKVENTNTMLDKFHLNWRVSKQPLILPSGIDSGFFGIVREDKQTTFATCKSSYSVFQNEQLAELVYAIAKESGYELKSGGTLNGGAKVYLQLKTNEINGLGENKTTVKGYTTALNSHDGTMSLRWGHSNITVCCENTFFAAAKQLLNSARHTESIHQRVEQSLKELNRVAEQEKNIFETYFKWATIPATKEQIVKVVKNITSVDILNPTANQKLSGYVVNRANELTSDIANEMSQKGDTLWGLFSGVTKYTTHHMPAPKREAGREESKMIGGGATIDNNIYEMVEIFAK